MLRQWRRRRTLARHTIPDALWTATLADLNCLAALDAQTEQKLRELALLFLFEKSLEAGAHFQLNDAMRLRIAVLACRPILQLGLDSYADFVSVVVHPDEFVVTGREQEDEDGVVHVGDDVLSGEAWEQGPVVLAWADVLASGQGDGFDVVAHEFAHKLDLLDGSANGVPPLHADMPVAEWIAAFQGAYDRLRAQLEHGDEPWLDPYAAEDPAEFFAVCSEMFFDVPADFADAHPDVYRQLARFYKQDPAGADR